MNIKTTFISVYLSFLIYSSSLTMTKTSHYRMKKTLQITSFRNKIIVKLHSLFLQKIDFLQVCFHIFINDNFKIIK